MKLNTFINRPVLSTVISIIIVILGFIGLSSLPIEQYPDVAPPTISVSANYQGASAETVLNSVVTPLEEQINGVEGMTYMTSTAPTTVAAVSPFISNMASIPTWPPSTCKTVLPKPPTCCRPK